MPSTSTLRALANLISSAVDEIERSSASRNLAFPDLDELFTVESEAARTDPNVTQSASVIIAAASQLIATVQPPENTLVKTALGFHVSAALQTVLISNVAECLRENGKKGVHIDKVAAAVKGDSAKLARVLRLLATHHIFREVEPNVFTNNRLSSLLDTGKSVKELQAKPLDKHIGTPGLAAMIEHLTDEAFKGSAYLADTLVDPKTMHSTSPTQTPLNRAFNNEMNPFAWFELPENLYRLKRFGVAMSSTEKVSPTDKILDGFEWGSLDDGSLVVDVGGGIGNTTLPLSRVHPNLRYIIQDRPAVVEQGIKFWQETSPDALNSGMVKLQGHDFLEPQPIKDASVFMLRMILHDWSDPFSEKILRHLRAAATPNTKLLIVDNLVPYACVDTTDYEGIPGAKMPIPPAPLLANLGQASSAAYLADIQMLVGFNAQERTIGQFEALFNKTDWKLTRIYRTSEFSVQKIVAVPK